MRYNAGMELPEKYKERMIAQLGAEEYAEYTAALARPPVKGLHVNTLKARVGEAEKTAILERLPYGENCYAVKDGRPTLHPYYRAGLYYMQEPSAMLPIAYAPIERGMRVLDMCASPGGKSSQAAIKLGGEGLLVSNEIDRKRALVLRENIVTLGYTNTVVTNMRPDALARTFGAYFDAVIVDAPGSGEGMFRKEEQAILDWSPQNVRACAARQREILISADECLKEGGLLVYSTCTFSPEEDEENVGFLTENGYEILPCDVAGAVCKGFGYKFYPHKTSGEGQFFCLLRKTKPSGAPKRLQKLQYAGKRETDAIAEFADISGLKIARKNGMLFVPAIDADIPCLVSGVLLAETERDGRLTPAHQAFTAFGNRFRRTLDLPSDDPRISAYLRGEEIAGDVKGWCAVCVDGHPLGGGKGSSGVIKNHYPKHMRLYFAHR